MVPFRMIMGRISIDAAATRIRNEFGRLDVLINNAAISNAGFRPGRTIEEYSKKTRPGVVSLDKVRAVWQTNVFGALAVYQSMLPLLREAPHDRIVNAATDADDLGQILRLQGDLAGAQRATERALQIDERVYGPGSPRLAIVTSNFGVILKERGDLAGSQTATERALQMVEKLYGPPQRRGQRE